MSDFGIASRWATRARTNFAVLRLRDLRYVFGATLVSSLGDGMAGIALAFAVLDLTHSATDLGLIMAARTITTIVMVLLGGTVADRMSRRTVMMGADLVRFGGQVAIGILLISHEASMPELIGSQILVAAGNGFFEPASMGLIQAAAGEHMQEANALKVIATSSTSMLGPAIGGTLVATVGGSYGLVADGVTYLLSAVLLSQVGSGVKSTLVQSVTKATFLEDLRGGFHEVRSRTWIWATILNMAIGNMLMAAYPVLGPLIAKQHYGGAPAWAALNVLWAVGMLIGGTSLLRFKPRYPMRAGVIALLPASMPLVLLGLHAPLYAIAPFQVMSGIGMTMLNALWWTAMQEHVPAAAISRVSSFDWAGTLAVQPIGLALVGPLAAAISAQSAMLVCGIAFAGISASALLVPAITMLPSGRQAQAENVEPAG